MPRLATDQGQDMEWQTKTTDFVIKTKTNLQSWQLRPRPHSVEDDATQELTQQHLKTKHQPYDDCWNSEMMRRMLFIL